MADLFKTCDRAVDLYNDNLAVLQAVKDLYTDLFRFLNDALDVVYKEDFSKPIALIAQLEIANSKKVLNHPCALPLVYCENRLQ